MQTLLTWIGGAAVLFVIGFLGGAHWESKQCQRNIAARQAQFEANVAAANKATEIDMEQLSGELRLSEKAIEKARKDYDDVLAKRTEAACLLTADDVRRLR